METTIGPHFPFFGNKIDRVYYYPHLLQTNTRNDLVGCAICICNGHNTRSQLLGRSGCMLAFLSFDIISRDLRQWKPAALEAVEQPSLRSTRVRGGCFSGREMGWSGSSVLSHPPPPPRMLRHRHLRSRIRRSSPSRSRETSPRFAPYVPRWIASGGRFPSEASAISGRGIRFDNPSINPLLFLRGRSCDLMHECSSS